MGQNAAAGPDTSPQPSAARPRRRRWIRSLVAAGVVTALLVSIGVPVLRGRAERAVLGYLRSPVSNQRKVAAWLIADNAFEAGAAEIAKILAEGREGDLNVREAFIYALGLTGRAEDFDLVCEIAQHDASGYVRQAAWLAAARVDEHRFRSLAPAVPEGADPWDQIGLANAWIRIGDLRGLATLLHWAEHGTPDQRLISCNALYRGLKPLLETVGRWPLEAEVREGQIWPAELVQEVGRRAARYDLARIARQNEPHLAVARAVQRNTHRLISARNWLARLFQAI